MNQPMQHCSTIQNLHQVFKRRRVRGAWGEAMKGGDFRSKIILCMVMFFVSSLPLGSGQYSDIAFLDGTVAPAAGESRAVDLNSNGTLLASGYDGLVALHQVDTLGLVTEFPVASDVFDVQFSPDGSYLAYTRSGSSSDTDTVQIYNVDEMRSTSKQHGSNSQPEMIQWSPNSQYLAIPNSNNGVDIVQVTDMQIENVLNGAHNTRVTCISYSSLGNYILSGDESGRVVMWDGVQGDSTGKEWTLDSKIVGCSFDPKDEYFGVLTENGQLSTFSFAGGLLSEVFLDGGSAFHWSSDSSQIHVSTQGITPRILTVDSSSLEEINSLYLSHQSMDFAFLENDFGTRNMVFVATDTAHIAAYGVMTLPDGYGEIGSDLDGDGVPDTFDDDDDGDAISDNRDNYCVDNVRICSETPDVNSIRQVDFYINSTHFVVQDTFTLDDTTSSMLRNLSRRSIIADTQLSQDETELFSQAICKNMNNDHFVSSWLNVIQLSSGELQDGKVECAIANGMTLTAKTDQTTLISITYVLTFNLSSSMSYPFEFTLQSQPLATDSSFAQHAEMHPIDVSAHSTKSKSSYWSPWWIIQGELSFTLEEEIEPEPSVSEKISEILISYPILFVPILGLLVAGIVFIIRIQNSIDIDLDDELEENAEDEFDSESESIEMEYEEEELEESEGAIDEPQSTRRKVRRKPKEEAESKPVVARRKRKSIPKDEDGPITKVKRRRLDEDISTSVGDGTRVKTSKRKVVSKPQKSEVVKTRRVVTYSDTDGEEASEDLNKDED